MKKVMLLMLAMVALSQCQNPNNSPPDPPPHYYTFDEVSKPYLDQYGPAEEINKYTSSDYNSVDWWWWSKGFEVTFVDTSWDDVNGWKVESTYSFTPI